MLVAHAITAAPPVAVAAPGLRAETLRLAEAAGVVLWSTALDDAVRLDRDDALEHHRLVERICAVQPCLPVRFGTAFPTEDAALASLKPRAGALRDRLERLAGKSEVALTLLWRAAEPSPSAPATDTGPGRRYLEERRAHFAADAERRARATAILDAMLAELAIERALVWHEICKGPEVGVSLAVLVPTDRADAMKGRLAQIAARFSDVVPVLNGPWPPYSFARVE